MGKKNRKDSITLMTDYDKSDKCSDNNCSVLSLSCINTDKDLKTTFSSVCDKCDDNSEILKTTIDSSIKSEKCEKNKKKKKITTMITESETNMDSCEVDESKTIVEKDSYKIKNSDNKHNNHIDMSLTNDITNYDENNYEEISDRRCEKIIEKYTKYHDMIRANNDIIVMLEFLGSKLKIVEMNVMEREFIKYSIRENVIWMESYIDKLFCIVRKNEAYKSICVKDYKLRNDESRISDRIYYIKIGYMDGGNKVIKTITIKFEWVQLTNNSGKSFMAILNKVVKEIEKEIARIRSLNILPFME
jgi:hypothetical protein